MKTFSTLSSLLLLATTLGACDEGVDDGLSPEAELDEDDFEFRQTLVPPPGWNQDAAMVYTEIVLVNSHYEAPFRETSRFFYDPVFWFANWTGAPGELEVRDYLEKGVVELTKGVYVPQFIYETTPPPNPDDFVVVTFWNQPWGQSNAVPQAFNGGVDVTGGTMFLGTCDPATNAYLCRGHEAHVRHELTHLLLGTGGHSGSRRSNMGYHDHLPDLDPLEQLAVELHYSIPRGTSFEQLEDAGIITSAMLAAHRPALSEIADTNQPERGSAGEPGDTLKVGGSYLRYPYGRSRQTPAGWIEPVVEFTGAAAVPIGPGHSVYENNWVEVTVPLSAESGPVTITSWESGPGATTSDPIWFHVRDSALDSTCSATYGADEGVHLNRDFITHRYEGSFLDEISFSFSIDSGGAENTSYEGDWDCFCFSRPWDPLRDGDWYGPAMSSPDLLVSGTYWGPDSCSYSGPAGNIMGNEAWCYSVLYAKTGGGTAACLDISNLSVN